MDVYKIKPVLNFSSLIILFNLLFCSQSIFSQGVFTSLATGNWSASTSWTLNSGSDADGVPDADDNVTINNVLTITVDGAYQCANMNLGGSDNKNAFLTISGTNSLIINGI